MSRRRKVTYAIVGTLVVLALLVYVLLQSEWLVLRLVATTIDRLQQTGAKIEIGEVSGTLLSGITLSEVEVTPARGEEPIFSADMVSLRYSPLTLATRRQLGTFSLYGPRIFLEKKNGTWNYSPLFARDDSTVAEVDTSEGGGIGGTLPFSLKHMSIQNGVIEVKADRHITVSKINIFASVATDTSQTLMTLHNGRFTVNDRLKVVSARGNAALSQSGLSLRGMQLKTDRSSANLNADLDTLGMYVSLRDCGLDLAEFSEALVPELDLRGQVRVDGEYRQVGPSRDGRCDVTASGAHLGEKDLGRVNLSLNVQDSDLDVRLNRWQLGQGAAEGSISVNLEGEKPSFSVDCSMDTFELGKLVGREMVLSGNFKVRGTGNSLENAGAMGEVSLGHSTVEGITLEELVSTFSYTSGVVILDGFESRLGGGSIVASGRVSKNQIELDTEIHGLDISEFGASLGLTKLKGTLSSYMWVSGPLDNPSLSGTAWLSKAEYGDMRFEHLGTNINIQDAVKEPKGFASLDLAGVELGGPPLKQGAIEVTAFGNNVDYEIWATVPEGSLDVKGMALFQDDRFQGELERLFVTYRGQVVENVGKIAASYSQSGVVLAPAALKMLGTEMRLTGFTLKPDEAQLGLAADSLSLKELGLAIGSDLEIDGFLSFDFIVGGTPQDPDVNLSLDLRDVTAGQASLDSAIANISYGDKLVKLNQFLVYRNERKSTLTGYFPVDLSLGAEGSRIPEAPISVNANFNDVGAWIFLPLKDIVSVDEGRIDADLSLRGTTRNPLMTGTMEVWSPKVIFRPTLTTAKDVAARLRLEGERLEIVSITGKAGEGDASVNGYIVFEGVNPVDYRVNVKAREASMEDFYRDIRDAVVNADVSITSGQEMLEVSGDVEVLKCLLTTEFRTSTVPMAAVKHDVMYDITVHADRNVRLENRDAEIEMATDVRVKWKPGKMVLSGVMEILGGTFSYAGLTQEFTVKRGEFIFSNAPELNPSLDIQAERPFRIQPEDTLITVLLTVGGTMLEPEFRLSSPDYPGLTETQILSLIGIGLDPMGGVDTGTNPLTQAGDIGISLLQKRIVKQLEKSIGVDEITVRSELLGSERTAIVRVGKYVRPDLYLSYSHDLFATVKDEYRAEYHLWRHSSIVGGRNNEGWYHVGMGFRFRY
jgi:autotransporter translocation and assembly factor TamB